MLDLEQKAVVALDWWVRCYLRKYLEQAGLDASVKDLDGLAQIQSLDDAKNIGRGLAGIENDVAEAYSKRAYEMGIPFIEALYNKVNDTINLADQGELLNRDEINQYVDRISKLIERLTVIACLNPDRVSHLGNIAQELADDLGTRLGEGPVEPHSAEPAYPYRISTAP